MEVQHYPMECELHRTRPCCLYLIWLEGVYMKKWLIVICILLAMSGCKPWPNWIDIDEFTELEWYSANPGKGIGKGKDILENIFELEGLSNEEYLYDINPGLYGKMETTKGYMIMRKELDEPILRYEVKKIEIHLEKDKSIVIEDNNTIDDIIQIRKGQNALRLDQEYMDALWKQQDDVNGFFYFDLPCDLIWECYITCNENESVYLIGYNAKESVWYQYDITAVIAGVLQKGT